MLDTGQDPNRGRRGQSDPGANLRRVLIPWYENGHGYACGPWRMSSLGAHTAV